MGLAWKANWEATQRHFIDWWNQDGLVLGSWSGIGGQPARDPAVDPGVPESLEERYTNAAWRAQSNYYRLARMAFPLDMLPIGSAIIGPGSLALALGSEPGISRETVWFHRTMVDEENPEALPPARFDPENRWFKIHEASLRASVALGQGKYLTGMPDLVENLDILGALREPQTLLIDMLERPEWVKEKVWEINQVYFEVFQRLYDIIKQPDGSSCFDAFALWGPGKTAKVQCDTSAMFSPQMFAEFVVPALTAQCEWLDHSMFHLDGKECLQHLDLLLNIEALDAIEWTPSPNVPSGGDPYWYPMYRKIIDAGKSVQAVGVQPEQVLPLLDAVGGKGMYIQTGFSSIEQAETFAEKVEQYR